MVHFAPVCQLVYHDVVKYFLRGKNKPPVEIEISFAAAASPAGLLFADGDMPIGDVHDGGVVSGLLGENVPGDANVMAAGTVIEGRGSLGTCEAYFL